MLTVRLRYIHEDVDRHGNVRIYFWRKGQRKVRIRARSGTAEFEAAYRAALAQSEAGSLSGPADAKGGHPAPGTYRWLCVQYFGSPEFRRLDPRTQWTRRGILESTFNEPIAPGAKELFADFPLARMTAKAVRVLRDRKAGLPEAANNRLKSVRRVFAWAMDNEHVTANPARDVPYVRTGTQGHHTWTLSEVEQYEQRHPVGSKARLALALLMYTGTRRSDVVLLGRQHVRNGWLKFTQQKNRNRRPVVIELPILPALQTVISASPTGDLTYLVTEHGKPYTAAGFGNWFRDRCNDAGLSHCSAHGLRKAGATIAAENGATTHQLMAIFGWLTIKEAERYTQAAQRKRMAGDAIGLLMRQEAKE
jgi:integrase